MNSNCETQKIQESINNSWKEEDERVIQGNWTSDLPFYGYIQPSGTVCMFTLCQDKRRT